MQAFSHPRNGNREKGAILILSAIVVFVLAGFLGLALDAAYMYFHKRAMQTAADAAAYAGALERLRGNSGAVYAAKVDASMNGFADGVNGVQVTVNVPPASGSQAGNANFVEVIISDDQPTWFMRALRFNSMNVKARAVAGLGNTGNGCVYALNQDLSNSNNGFFVNGTTDSQFSCGVFSNAHFRSVGGACVVTPAVSFTGDYENHNSYGECGPKGMSKGVPVVDPLKGRFSVPSGSCTANNFRVNKGDVVVISPGVYCGGISISGTVDQVVFSPGVYVLRDGGLSINGGMTVTGTDVTFFNTFTASAKYGPIDMHGSGLVTLTAPTSGPYAGLLFYQDPRVSWRANNGSTVAGSVDSVFQGMIYFPTTDLTFSGNSSIGASGTGYTTLIAYNVKINGTARINADYSMLGGMNPLQNVLFAE